MSKEQYVSFEIAKLLKEKGFNGYCHVVHINNHNSLIGKVISNSELITTHEYKFCKDQENCITIPTQQMACRWLREVHNIHIGVFIDIDKYVAFLDEIPATGHTSTPIEGDFTTYEDAIESALEYVLKNLI